MKHNLLQKFIEQLKARLAFTEELEKKNADAKYYHSASLMNCQKRLTEELIREAELLLKTERRKNGEKCDKK